ncbi:MAG: hypothetical protein IH905_17955 [Proteobacteria bacterium]|nr:hypothetical protein [Pseudomonadota bacterium]
MSITRRDALLGATAAAAVTGLTTAPLAMKAAGVKAALAGPTDEPLIAMEREWNAHRHSCDNCLDDSDEAREPHFRRLEEMEWNIYQTPARTLQGVATKLRLWSRYYAEFYDRSYEGAWWQGDLEGMTYAEFGFANVMRDLERLAGEARS